MMPPYLKPLTITPHILPLIQFISRQLWHRLTIPLIDSIAKNVPSLFKDSHMCPCALDTSFTANPYRSSYIRKILIKAQFLCDS